ncbi:MAG: hypothetical protein H7Y42_16635 [Chitinophagaceae bacterium]|nr:hypothetical protein [Chitinophagaceae bacterium]
MKNIPILIILFLLSAQVNSAIVKWDGDAGDGLWQSGDNWIGNVVPGSGDEVVLDHSVLATSYVVTLPLTSVSIISIRISPDAGVGTIRLVIPSSSTITTNAFMTTGTGYTMTLERNAIFENNATVAAGTNLSIADSFRINNGARYIHRTRSGHAGWASRLARVTGTEDGTMEFDVPTASYVISLSGRTYGNLIFSSYNHILPVTYSGTGASPLIIRGSLTINNNAGFSTSLSADMVIHGNCNLTGNTSMFNVQNSTFNNTVRLLGNITSQGVLTKTGAGFPQLVMSGSAPQQVSITGSFLNNIRVVVDNPVGVALMASLSLPYHLQLVNGIIRTGATYTLTIVDNAVVSGGGSASFVDGNMTKTGDEAFTFHVGEGLEYAPIAISAGGASTDVFTARYARGNPMIAIGNLFEAPAIDHMSSKEWWTLERIVGIASRDVTLHTRTFTDATVLPELRILRWDGAIWLNVGNSATAGTPAAGSVTSNPITNFLPSGSPTPFTFGSISSLSNPLPINLVSFSADVQSGNRVLLKWELADDPNGNGRFEIQRAGSTNAFVSSCATSYLQGKRNYEYIDNNPQRGENRYRLKIIEEDGFIAYSTIVKVMNTTETDSFISLENRIEGDHVAVTIDARQPVKLSLILIDMYGRRVFQKQQFATAGITRTHFSMRNLSRGAYVLIAMVDGRKCSVNKFMW